MILHLGVIDVPEPEGGTTYGVATALEQRYGLFSAFADYDKQKIVDHLAESMAGALETMMQGGNVKDPFAAATSEIEREFKDFLSLQIVETLGIPGVPTQAALEGKSTRFKNRVTARSYVNGKRAPTVKVKGDRRPSFIDSGVMQASFKSWVD